MTGPGRARPISLLVVIALCGGPAPLFAQSDVVRRAKALVAEADELYEARQFEEAAAKYSAAYELVPDPVLIGTESVTWYKAGDCGRSLRLVDEFADTQEPGSPLPSQLQEVQVGCALRDVGAALEKGDYDEAERALARAAAVAQPSDRQQERMQNLAREIEVARADAERNDQALDSGMTPRKKLGWALFGTGGVVAASSIVTYLGHQRQLDEYKALTARAACSGEVDGRFETCEFASDKDKDAAAEAHRKVVTNAVATYALLGTGAALATVGVILLSTKPKERAKLLVGPTSIGVGFSF